MRESEILRIMGKKKEPLPRTGQSHTQVSSYDQVKDGDPDRQLEHLRGSHRYQKVLGGLKSAVHV